MKLSDFDYDLPAERIAQEPLPHRDASRLMRLDRRSGGVVHDRFDRFPDLLRPGDLVVLNDTRVLAARLSGRKATGGRVQLLLVEPLPDRGEPNVWRCLLDASRPPRVGSDLDFGQGLRARVLARGEEHWRIRFEADGGNVGRRLAGAGSMPLPPYIRREETGAQALDDRERYQTVFAEKPGAVAAPTAGLHFTETTLSRLRERDVAVTRLTLHVGPGTFLPVRTERLEEHRMHSERFELPEDVARAVERTRREQGRVVAVGTTVVRALESRAREDGRVEPGAGRCDLFILPGYRFRAVDVLLTNFHLPRSTLLMLVSAFAGRMQVLEAYRQAVAEAYRFYSYGDAMLVG